MKDNEEDANSMFHTIRFFSIKLTVFDCLFNNIIHARHARVFCCSKMFHAKDKQTECD